MDDPMETERVADIASSKRPAAEKFDDVPRARKRSRKAASKKNSNTPSFKPKRASRRNKPILSPAHSVTPEPTVKEESEPSLPTPPSILKPPKEVSPAASNGARVTFAADNPETNGINRFATAELKQALPSLSPRDPITPPPPTQPRASRLANILFKLLLLVGLVCAAAAIFPRTTNIRTFQHVIPPQHAIESLSADLESFLSNTTLRDFLMEDFHLALAPSFFGFFGYFGLLQAWDEQQQGNSSSWLDRERRIRSVAGASAGAMAANLLALGIPPAKAAEFCSTIDLPTFADPPGIGSFFKGDRFQQLMHDFMRDHLPTNHTLQMQHAHIPVAVTGFDLQTLSTLTITQGCAARSSRASATFPFLFQPVHWKRTHDETNNQDYVLIDGGVLDPHGLVGLSAFHPAQRKRVVNVVVGSFGGGVPPGPSELPQGVVASELLSISMRHLPQCGPWAMENGPRAVEAARQAMMASLDLPLYRGKEDGHYELHIDAASFVS